jgi:hypothetical protein
LLAKPESLGTIDDDVGGKCQKAKSNDPMRNGLNLRAPGFMEIRPKAPLRYPARTDLNDTVDAETDKCNAAGKQPRNQRSNCFQAVISNRRVAQSDSAADKLFSGQLSHIPLMLIV